METSGRRPPAAARVDRAGIEATRAVIGPYIRVTPTVELAGADIGLDDCTLVLKLEQLQHSGSFKTRGAFANLLMRDVPAAGVVAASGGNHGAAVAYAAMRLSVPAKIFVPTVSSPAKIQRIREYGADLAVVGERYADALAASDAWAARSGALPVHAFDQLETLLGQGTIGMEVAAQAPALDTLLVPVGGGGLIGGIAAWYAGTTRIVGVEPEDAPTLTEALRAGRPVDAVAGGIAADSLAPRRVGELTFPIARDHVDRVVLVGDAAIRKAQETLWAAARIVAEPGAAALLQILGEQERRDLLGRSLEPDVHQADPAPWTAAASTALCVLPRPGLELTGLRLMAAARTALTLRQMARALLMERGAAGGGPPQRVDGVPRHARGGYHLLQRLEHADPESAPRQRGAGARGNGGRPQALGQPPVRPSPRLGHYPWMAQLLDRRALPRRQASG